MFNPESFCGEVWNQIEINTLGDYKICCLANFDDDYGLAFDEAGNVMNVMTHSFKEAINSATHKDHRLQLKENIKVKRCRNCYDSEDSIKGDDKWGNEHIKKWGRSKRQRVNAVTTKLISEYVTADTADQYTLEDGSSTAKLVNLGLRISNLCNQKCIMCSPEFSSLWSDDWVELYGYDANVLPPDVYDKTYKIEVNEIGKNKVNYANWWDSDIWWQRFEEIAPDLRHIYFSGGEPLIAPILEEILKRLVEKNFARRIILRFDTNLSALNTRIIDQFKHFRKINFCVSMDDVAERYELIRFPGKFNTLVKNITTLKDNGMDIHYLSCCVGVGSIYSMIRVTELAEQLGVPCEFRYLEGPYWLDLRSLPVSAKKEIIEVYKGLTDHSEVRRRWYSSMIKFLEKYMHEKYVRTDRLTNFVTTMDKLDKLRATDWRTTLPDICDILRRHCPETGA